VTRVAGRGALWFDRWIPLSSALIVTTLGGVMAATGATVLLSG
jgi:hypothetical protein